MTLRCRLQRLTPCADVYMWPAWFYNHNLRAIYHSFSFKTGVFMSTKTHVHLSMLPIEDTVKPKYNIIQIFDCPWSDLVVVSVTTKVSNSCSRAISYMWLYTCSHDLSVNPLAVLSPPSASLFMWCFTVCAVVSDTKEQFVGFECCCSHVSEITAEVAFMVVIQYWNGTALHWGSLCIVSWLGII